MLANQQQLYKGPDLSLAVLAKHLSTARKLVTTQTLFSAGSISKLVGAVEALKLVEQGKLTLDAPINSYLTSWQLGKNDKTRQTPVTLRLLLRHRGAQANQLILGLHLIKNHCLPCQIFSLASPAPVVGPWWSTGYRGTTLLPWPKS